MCEADTMRVRYRSHKVPFALQHLLLDVTFATQWWQVGWQGLCGYSWQPTSPWKRGERGGQHGETSDIHILPCDTHINELFTSQLSRKRICSVRCIRNYWLRSGGAALGLLIWKSTNQGCVYFECQPILWTFSVMYSGQSFFFFFIVEILHISSGKNVTLTTILYIQNNKLAEMEIKRKPT